MSSDSLKECIAKTKERQDQCEMFLVTRKIGPVVAVSNGRIGSWLKETLTVAIISASGGSTRKAVAIYVGSQGASIRTIMEAVDWTHTSIMYG